MKLTGITLTPEEEFGALCVAKEINDRDKRDYDRGLVQANRASRDGHRAASKAAQEAHKESERVAYEAHEGEEPFVPTEYVEVPFAPDETPFSPRKTPALAMVALREMLAQCAERAHRAEVAAIGQSVMDLDHAARLGAIDKLTGSQD